MRHRERWRERDGKNLMEVHSLSLVTLVVLPIRDNFKGGWRSRKSLRVKLPQNPPQSQILLTIIIIILLDKPYQYNSKHVSMQPPNTLVTIHIYAHCLVNQTFPK